MPPRSPPTDALSRNSDRVAALHLDTEDDSLVARLDLGAVDEHAGTVPEGSVAKAST
jgi:hypothetical protein